MSRSLLLTCAAGVVLAVGGGIFARPLHSALQHGAAHARAGLAVPGSVHAEHQRIDAALEEALEAPGEIGSAARALAEVLRPHFEREEQIALPPLGLLAPLAGGEQASDYGAALRMTDTLRDEMPRMLDEHKTIRTRVLRLAEVARAVNAPRHEEFAEELARHAQAEEEVFYPAALLVGDVIRARTR
jgi:hypothetical protein